MAVYIIQFSGLVGERAQFYVGYASSKARCYDRLAMHRAGYGAKICRAASIDYGLELEIVFIITKGTRKLERRIKNMKSHRRVLNALLNDKFTYKEGDLHK